MQFSEFVEAPSDVMMSEIMLYRLSSTQALSTSDPPSNTRPRLAADEIVLANQ
jgi:hypothetical protein